MDIVSHGLWGAIAFGRRNRRSFWLSFFFGVMPDLMSFGIFFTAALSGFDSFPDWSQGRPADSAIPPYVHALYGIWHSVIVFAAVF